MCKSMLLLVFYVCAAFLGVSADPADTSIIAGCPQQALTPFYTTLGCEPLKEKDAECPTSYNCSKFEERDPKLCHAGTKSYNLTEVIDDSPSHCMVACFCSESYQSKEGRPHIVCAHVDCPWAQLDPGCTYKYSSDKCCPSVECGNTTSVEPKVSCDFENKTWTEGQTFEPQNNPCTVCTCQKGFKGVVEEPFCRQEDCKAQIQYNGGQQLNSGCAPVFYGTNRCCPIDWKCPDKSDVIVKAITKSNHKTTATCKFGDLTLEPGDTLNITSTSYVRQDCSCDLPPYLTCIQPEQKYTE